MLIPGIGNSQFDTVDFQDQFVVLGRGTKLEMVFAIGHTVVQVSWISDLLFVSSQLVNSGLFVLLELIYACLQLLL